MRHLNKPNFQKVGYLLLGLCVVVFFTEHFGRQFNLTYRPSYALTKVSGWLETFFRGCGWLIAKLSCYLTWLNFEEVFQTCGDLMKPLANLVGSPAAAIDGYLQTVLTYDPPVLVLCGSLILLGVTIWCYIRYLHHRVARHISWRRCYPYVGVIALAMVFTMTNTDWWAKRNKMCSNPWNTPEAATECPQFVLKGAVVCILVLTTVVTLYEGYQHMTSHPVVRRFGGWIDRNVMQPHP
jgi:hypothetical protein